MGAGRKVLNSSCRGELERVGQEGRMIVSGDSEEPAMIRKCGEKVGWGTPSYPPARPGKSSALPALQLQHFPRWV